MRLSASKIYAAMSHQTPASDRQRHTARSPKGGYAGVRGNMGEPESLGQRLDASGTGSDEGERSSTASRSR